MIQGLPWILQQQLSSLFACGGFLLRKWNSSDPSVLGEIPEELRDTRDVQTISEINEYTKTLGIEWNISTDEFRLTIAESLRKTTVTKRMIVAKVFDVFGWFSPVTVKMNILLQRLWEIKLDWDDPIPDKVHQIWSQWRSELPLLTTMVLLTISRVYAIYWRAGASQPSRSFERNFLYIYIYAAVVRRVSGHARLLTRFFLSEIISKFFHIFTHAASRYDLASPRTLLHSTACTATFGD